MHNMFTNALLFLFYIYNLTNSQFSSFLERARSKSIGSLKQKCSWHDLMMSILLVLNNFMKNLSTVTVKKRRVTCILPRGVWRYPCT